MLARAGHAGEWIKPGGDRTMMMLATDEATATTNRECDTKLEKSPSSGKEAREVARGNELRRGTRPQEHSTSLLTARGTPARSADPHHSTRATQARFLCQLSVPERPDDLLTARRGEKSLLRLLVPLGGGLSTSDFKLKRNRITNSGHPRATR